MQTRNTWNKAFTKRILKMVKTWKSQKQEKQHLTDLKWLTCERSQINGRELVSWALVIFIIQSKNTSFEPSEFVVYQFRSLEKDRNYYFTDTWVVVSKTLSLQKIAVIQTNHQNKWICLLIVQFNIRTISFEIINKH